MQKSSIFLLFLLISQPVMAETKCSPYDYDCLKLNSENQKPKKDITNIQQERIDLFKTLTIKNPKNITIQTPGSNLDQNIIERINKPAELR